MAGNLHGTPARYKEGPDEDDRAGRGCRCDGCVAASSEYRTTRTRLIAYGRWQPYIPAGPAQEHLRMLLRYGYGPRQIGKLAGLGETTAVRILGHDVRAAVARVRPSTQAAILSVRPSLAGLNPGALIAAAGTRRRLQALMYLGWTVRQLAALTGRSRATVAHWLAPGPREKVPAKSARAVAAVYGRLWDTPPPETTRREHLAAERARRWARGHGWVPAAAWDDDLIDDPAAVPASGWERRGRRTRWASEAPPPPDVRAEEAAHLAGCGESLEQIAARLRVTAATVRDDLRRAGGAA